jgi:hypothetical protein
MVMCANAYTSSVYSQSSCSSQHLPNSEGGRKIQFVEDTVFVAFGLLNVNLASSSVIGWQLQSKGCEVYTQYISDSLNWWNGQATIYDEGKIVWFVGSTLTPQTNVRMMMDLEGNEFYKVAEAYTQPEKIYEFAEKCGDRYYAAVAYKYKDATMDSMFFEVYDKELKLVKKIAAPFQYPGFYINNAKVLNENHFFVALNVNTGFISPTRLAIWNFDSLGNELWHYEQQELDNGVVKSAIPAFQSGAYATSHYIPQADVDPKFWGDYQVTVRKFNTQGIQEWEYKDLFVESSMKTQYLLVYPNNDVLLMMHWNDNPLDAVYLLKISSAGERLWRRKITDSSSYGGNLQIRDIAFAPDGQICITGSRYDTVIVNNKALPDGAVWLLCLDSMGCLSPGCGVEQDIVTSTIEPSNTDLYNLFSVYPNPARYTMMLKAKSGNQDVFPASFKMYDMIGRQVLTHKMQYGTEDIDISSIQEGLYIWNLSSNGEVWGQGKVVVER